MKFLLAHLASLFLLFLHTVAAEDEKDAPEKLAQRYVEAFLEKDSDKFRAQWVTEELLRKYLRSQSDIPESEHATYIAEIIKKQNRVLQRYVDDFEKPIPKLKIESVKVLRLAPDGLSFNHLLIKLRDAVTGSEEQDTTPEGIKVDGRWYFIERPNRPRKES